MVYLSQINIQMWRRWFLEEYYMLHSIGEALSFSQMSQRAVSFSFSWEHTHSERERGMGEKKIPTSFSNSSTHILSPWFRMLLKVDISIRGVWAWSLSLQFHTHYTLFTNPPHSPQVRRSRWVSTCEWNRKFSAFSTLVGGFLQGHRPRNFHLNMGRL